MLKPPGNGPGFEPHPPHQRFDPPGLRILGVVDEERAMPNPHALVGGRPDLLRWPARTRGRAAVGPIGRILLL